MIRLHNSRTRRKEDFTPIDPSNVRMYVCGPTVYDRAHLGNARPVVVFDVLFRLLRHLYGVDHVTYVRNFTDVDDKINARARQMQQGGDSRDLNAIIRALTDETISWYHADMDALGALRPTHEPRATEYIGQMVAMITGLIAGGHAYAEQGHVLFDVHSYRPYGALSGRSLSDMIAGARVEIAPYKRDPMDFVLWKPSADDEPGWDSPWGRGRPGWHIECSAMSHELLGASFDIHGGGIDLQFPHHENEIAQSCCAHPEGDFARFWLHNEMVQVEGKKMSKSLGNFFTVRDLLWKGFPGEVIRFLMLQTHYRKPMDWTDSRARDAEKTIRKWRYIAFSSRPSKNLPSEIVEALQDDLNTAKAISILHRFAKDGNGADLLAGAQLLGILTDQGGTWFDPSDHSLVADDARISEINQIRILARRAGRFDLADDLRQQLIESGVEVFDNKFSSAAFRGTDALMRSAQHALQKAWKEGDEAGAQRYVSLLNSSGYQISFDHEGPSAIYGFDEDAADRHFEQSIPRVLEAARSALQELEADE